MSKGGEKMKEIKFKFTLSIGFAVHDGEVTLEFEDDATQDEIQKEVGEHWQEWSSNYIDGGWDIIE